MGDDAPSITLAPFDFLSFASGTWDMRVAEWAGATGALTRVNLTASSPYTLRGPLHRAAGSTFGSAPDAVWVLRFAEGSTSAGVLEEEDAPGSGMRSIARALCAFDFRTDVRAGGGAGALAFSSTPGCAWTAIASAGTRGLMSAAGPPTGTWVLTTSGGVDSATPALSLHGTRRPRASEATLWSSYSHFVLIGGLLVIQLILKSFTRKSMRGGVARGAASLASARSAMAARAAAGRTAAAGAVGTGVSAAPAAAPSGGASKED